jgi:hypothetical protein
MPEAFAETVLLENAGGGQSGSVIGFVVVDRPAPSRPRST